MMIGVYIGQFCVTSITWFFLTWFPTYLYQAKGMSILKVGFVASIPAIAWILGQTRRIRVGSGGVMLQHYSPYKVAENFNMLASLAPGRVDLGVGKAPGGLPLSTRALQQGLDPQQKGRFADQLAQLDNWLALTETDGEESVRATPIPPRRADGFLL
ncbi:LLM class flavin-dependent oxidoreductase, partial [Klebsiella michiganensis]